MPTRKNSFPLSLSFSKKYKKWILVRRCRKHFFRNILINKKWKHNYLIIIYFYRIILKINLSIWSQTHPRVTSRKRLRLFVFSLISPLCGRFSTSPFSASKCVLASTNSPNQLPLLPILKFWSPLRKAETESFLLKIGSFKAKLGNFHVTRSGTPKWWPLFKQNPFYNIWNIFKFYINLNFIYYWIDSLMKNNFNGHP